MVTTIKLIANEGFEVCSGDVCFYVDAFFDGIPGLVKASDWLPARPAQAILATHSHWDHFDPALVAEAARRTGAAVVGPAKVMRSMRKLLPPERLVELEPPRAAGDEPAAAVSARVGPLAVTAFRTFHGQDHNSYLVELPGLRLFHDGDNEDTRRITPERLGRLDVLMIAPWQGSGWAGFIEALAPRRWFMMHLDADELARHERGQYLGELCGRVPCPEALVVLRPRQAYEL